MAKIELFKGKSKVLTSLIDVEGWAKQGYKAKKDAYDALCTDSEREYVKKALVAGASFAEDIGEGE
jgi:hypothetical protein